MRRLLEVFDVTRCFYIFFFAGKYFNAVLKKSQVVEIIYFCLKNVFLLTVGNKLEAGLTNSSWWIDQGTLTEGEGSVRLTSSLR